jgi:beta-glucosidase
VAGVLFGRRPFTGRLPVSWSRSEFQAPVNVGDRDYDPSFRSDSV